MIELMDADDQGSSTAARRRAGHHLDTDIAIDDAGWLDAVPGVEDLTRRAARQALVVAGDRYRFTVSIVLGDDQTVRRLNRSWRGIDKATNVLSFPALEVAPDRGPEPEPGHPKNEPIALGDVIVARQTVLHEAAMQDKTASDHLAHLIIHGVLHLLGYDHLDDGEADRMEALEAELLGHLGIADPYR
ncbi:MAG: rRNA maturation RNase YbeY [Pseudomonadota bacterium]